MSNHSKDKKVVLITGASSGIGEASAIAFANAGFQVVAAIRNQNKAAALLESGQHHGVNFDVCIIDVCDDHSVNNGVESMLEKYGHIDVLVNNAGTGYRGTLEQTPIKDIQRMMDVNYYSVARVTKAVLPSMRERGTGHIISVSSLGGLIAIPFTDAYCAAKFAVEGMMEALAPVAATFGVHVSLIEPGPVHTNFLNNVEGNSSSRQSEDPYFELEQAYLKTVPMRFATTGQTADAIAKVIVNAAMSDQPHLRYPTSASATQIAARKYVDVTGDAILQATSQLILKTANA